MKQRILPLLALLLLPALLLQGCTPLWNVYDEILSPLDVNRRPDYSDGEIDFSDFDRPYMPRLDYVSFDEIEYERPDTDALCQNLRALGERAKSADIDRIMEDYETLYNDYVLFDTMSQLAYLRYTLDLNDSFYETEYTWCEEQSPLVEQALEECYTALGASPLRTQLETEYFGKDYFDHYDEQSYYTNDRVVELLQQESELQTKYMAMQSDMTVEHDGREQLVSDLLSDSTLSYEEYYEILERYGEKFAPQAAEIYIALIRVRRALAEELGYEDYAQYAYDYYYERDYTPKQVERYLADIRAELVPVYEQIPYIDALRAADSSKILELLRGAATQLGGEVQTAYGFMEAYSLCDISASTSKLPGSYTTYLESYEMPFIYISPEGSLNDLLTAAHEFGHFIDAYVNCNCTTSTDCAEVFSQGLEYLTLDAAELSAYDRMTLEYYKLADALEVFLTQACYYEFEQRAYALDNSELTAERLNELFLECTTEYGLYVEEYGSYNATNWIDIQHFFIAPYYVISYCVSNDAALQIYERELERKGSGLSLYTDLLYLAPNNTLLSMLEEGGMQSPFDAGRVAMLADFFAEQLGV